MNLLRRKFSRIKNLPVYRLEKDFNFNVYSLLLLVVLTAGGTALAAAPGGSG